MIWKPEDQDQIIALYGHESASIVGEKFGVSRNAIVGLWWRHRKRNGLPAMKAGTRTGTDKPKLELPRVMPARRTASPVARRLDVQAVRVAARPVQIFCEPIGIHDDKLKWHHCRYEIGKCSRGLAIFCGSHVEASRSWCPGHARIVFAPTKLTEDYRSAA